MATLVTFRSMAGRRAAALAELGARASSRSPGPSTALDALRISVGFFTSDDELERFAEAVALLAAHTPGDDPAASDADDPRWLTVARPAGPPTLWAEVRWRQFRHAPRPIVRAVASSLIVAIVLAIAYLAYDVALSRGAALPGRRPAGRWRSPSTSCRVLVAGSVVTYLVVPQPTGSGTVARRSAWSAALGFFAAVPIAYLVLVVAVQVIRPLLG